ncbi:MAG: NAD(P)H-hydrate epimerase [Phycisphaerae bacterium]
MSFVKLKMHVALTRDQVRRVDQLAIERYGIAGVVLMENAGRGAAGVIRANFGDGGAAVILCGAGNNGGDGLVIARHLHNAGWTVRTALAGNAERMTPDARINHDIVRAMGLEIRAVPDARAVEVIVETIQPREIVVDALLGTGFRGAVRQPLADLIGGINGVDKRAVVAIDVPSGLDCDSGAASNATVRADLTITFVAPKIGFCHDAAASYVGRVEVVGIGAPRELLDEVLSGAD